jgi:hypothetical protein
MANLVHVVQWPVETIPLGCRTLAELRDTLLPKLISGEIRVHDVERAADVAV